MAIRLSCLTATITEAVEAAEVLEVAEVIECVVVPGPNGKEQLTA